MIERFFPKLIVDKIQDIDFQVLLSKNIKGLVLDIDNTLVPYHMKEADENAVLWIERVREKGLQACIVSNNSRKRVIKFNENLKLPSIYKAYKPGKKPFLQAARLMGLDLRETAVIGDQIFTDIYGGNRLGMFTILVKPIDKNEHVHIKVKRFAEKIVMRRFQKESREKVSTKQK